MITDDELCEYITQNPGKSFSSLRGAARFTADTGYRDLDKALQRLRRSGRTHYKKGGWYPGKEDTL